MNKPTIQKINRTSLRDQVYSALRQSIISLELPPEQKLNDAELAASFGVSRTPVREALKRLEDEGLIESFPGAVTRIAPLHTDAARHAFPVAASLHALATRLAVPLLQEMDIQELEQANKELIAALDKQDALAAIEADDRFHGVFLRVCANPELNHALQSVMSKIRRLELAKFSTINHTHSPEDHKHIIQACAEQDAQQAALYMEQNWLSLAHWLDAAAQDLPLHVSENGKNATEHRDPTRTSSKNSKDSL